MQTSGKGHNGNGSIERGEGAQPEPAPAQVRDLAEGCIRFVERALGVRLDYEAETLSILDHYLEESRKVARERAEATLVVAHTAGAYFGEVVRRRYPSWWRMEGDDPAAWRIELEPVYLSFSRCSSSPTPLPRRGGRRCRRHAGGRERWRAPRA